MPHVLRPMGRRLVVHGATAASGRVDRAKLPGGAFLLVLRPGVTWDVRQGSKKTRYNMPSGSGNGILKKRSWSPSTKNRKPSTKNCQRALPWPCLALLHALLHHGWPGWADCCARHGSRGWGGILKHHLLIKGILCAPNGVGSWREISRDRVHSGAFLPRMQLPS